MCVCCCKAFSRFVFHLFNLSSFYNIGSLWIDCRPDTGKFVSKSRYDAATGLYSTTMFATVHTNQTSFVCLLNINGTDYQRSTNNSASGKYDRRKIHFTHTRAAERHTYIHTPSEHTLLTYFVLFRVDLVFFSGSPILSGIQRSEWHRSGRRRRRVCGMGCDNYLILGLKM